MVDTWLMLKSLGFYSTLRQGIWLAGQGGPGIATHADVFTSPSIQQAQRETTGDLGSFFGFLNPKMKKWNFTWEIVDKLEVAKLGKERR
jgi:hypothetical protein